MFNHMALVCLKSDAGTKYWAQNQMMKKHYWNFTQIIPFKPGIHNLHVLLLLVAEAVIYWYHTLSYILIVF